MSTIDDGTGTGFSLRIDGSNRAKIEGVTKSIGQAASEREEGYNINSGLVTVTTVDEQGILYMKNNETRDIHITNTVLIFGPSTSGVTTDTIRARIYKNPTAGTLVSEAIEADTDSNRNFGSGDTLSIDAFKGDGSSTITDGSVHIESLISPGNRVPFPIEMILRKGNSIAITVEAPDSNTSMKCMVAIVCHLADLNA